MATTALRLNIEQMLIKHWPRIRFTVELASDNVFKQLSSGHPIQKQVYTTACLTFFIGKEPLGVFRLNVELHATTQGFVLFQIFL